MNRFEKPRDPDKEKKLKEFKDFSDEQVRKHGLTHAVLNEDGDVVLVSLFEWAFWFEGSRQRVIQQDYFRDNDYKVSTIFTGLDLDCTPAHPVWFETMVFGPEEECRMPLSGEPYLARPSLWTERCRSLKEALAAHEEGKKWLELYLHELDKNTGQNQTPSPVLDKKPETGTGD